MQYHAIPPVYEISVFLHPDVQAYYTRIFKASFRFNSIHNTVQRRLHLCCQKPYPNIACTLDTFPGMFSSNGQALTQFSQPTQTLPFVGNEA